MSYRIFGEHEGIKFEIIPDIIAQRDSAGMCQACHGRGSWWEDGKEDSWGDFQPGQTVSCSSCSGKGYDKVWSTPPVWSKTHPQLFADIQKAWREEWNRQENAKFKLTQPDPTPKS